MQINAVSFIQKQNSNPFVVAQLKKQNTLTETLGKLASNATVGLQQNQTIVDRVQEEVTKASMDNYTKTDSIKDNALSGMSTETLKNFAAIMQQTATLANAYNEEINVFREGLNSFDTTITKYENMLIGTEAIPGDLTIDSINNFIIQTKADKEIYRRNGSKLLQDRCQYYTCIIESCSKMAAAITGGDYSDIKDMNLEFNADAENVYDEMDRVSSHLENITGRVNDTLASIYKELEKRGVHDLGYQLYREQKDSNTWYNNLNPSIGEMYAVPSLMKPMPNNHE